MKKLETALCLVTTALLTLAVPAVASAEYLVPPSNSAATQYTEAIPSAGGPRDSNRRTGKGPDRSPDRVLGAHTAQRLREAGKPGREVAAVATETAPARLVRSRPQRVTQATANSQARADHTPVIRRKLPSGSDGLVGVLGWASGSSSGGVGSLLPLLLVSALTWAILFVVRRQKRMAA